MANSAWKTKADIVNDLTKGTGGYVDENFVVRGYRPPPTLRSNDVDEEMRLLFGDHCANIGAPVSADDDGFNPPDLRGIRQMLQLVNDLEDGSSKRASSIDRDLPAPDDIITISKLNPNVNEFVPKTHQASVPQVKTDSSDSAPEQPLQSESNQPDLNQPLNCLTEINKKSLVTDNFSNDDIKKLSETLKSKINNASKSDTFQSKREKNVAIATLLKLHANRVVDKENEPISTPPVLLPPDYYINKNPIKLIAEKDIASTATPTLLENLETDNPAVAEDLSLNRTLDISNNISQTLSESKSEPYDADKEIQSSIDKVTKWLNPTTSQEDHMDKSKFVKNVKITEKKPVSLLGPITFKKKENKTQSPIESKESTTPKKTKRDSKEFVPSQNAAKQSEVYMKRIKEREIKEQKNNSRITMENLEEQLRARDEKIRSSALNSSFTYSTSS